MGGPMRLDANARAAALSPFERARREAGQQAMGQAATLAGSNPFAAQRMGIDAGSRAMGRIAGDRAQAEAQMIVQQQQAAEMRKREEEARMRQMVGGLVGGAGQVLGTIMPAFAPAAGAANAVGGMIGGQPMGGGAPAAQATPQSITARYAANPYADPRQALGQMPLGYGQRFY